MKIEEEEDIKIVCQFSPKNSLILSKIAKMALLT